jgi:hypothetical protein
MIIAKSSVPEMREPPSIAALARLWHFFVGTLSHLWEALAERPVF